MIEARIRMPVTKDHHGKHRQKLGKPYIMYFNNRAELHQYMQGILKDARVQIINPEVPNTQLNNRMMQHICGVA